MAIEDGCERAAAEMEMSRATRSGYMAAAAKDCMPPSDDLRGGRGATEYMDAVSALLHWLNSMRMTHSQHSNKT